MLWTSLVGGLGGTVLHRHRVAVAAVAASLLLGSVAACGGSAAPSPTPAPPEAPPEAPVPSQSVATEAPSEAPPEESPSAPARMTAVAKCGGVALRKEPAKDGEVIVRAKSGTKVRVVETVTGDAYQGGTCGTSGDTWLKVDRIGGKSIKAQYGVPYGYVAAGFFE